MKHARIKHFLVCKELPCNSMIGAQSHTHEKSCRRCDVNAGHDSIFVSCFCSRHK